MNDSRPRGPRSCCKYCRTINKEGPQALRGFDHLLLLEVDAYTHFQLARIVGGIASGLSRISLRHHAPATRTVNVQGWISRLEVIQDIREQSIEGEPYVTLCFQFCLLGD